MSDDLVKGSAIVRSEGWRWQAIFWLSLAALPSAWLVRTLAFRFPETVDALYSRGLYPWLAAGLGLISGRLSVSLAELLVPLVLLGAGSGLVVTWRRTRGSRARKLGRVALVGWGGAGVLAWAFLLLWGFHYARPGLATRMELDTSDIASAEVLALGTRVAAGANRLRADLGIPEDSAPAPLPPRLDFSSLDAELDRAFDRLDLPGDALGRSPAPAKPLVGSELLSWLGISGIYVPFTGEPSVNAHAPDPSLPLIIAHEKAHQRGITDEGEANLAGLLAALASDDPYVLYAAHLDAAARLIGGAARYLPESERAAAWASLDPGPLADLRAISAYWRSYEGAARDAATRMNDAYLRSNRVPGGVQSYGGVTRLLVGAARGGHLSRIDGVPSGLDQPGR